jgi:hypothetical protein
MAPVRARSLASAPGRIRQISVGSGKEDDYHTFHDTMNGGPIAHSSRLTGRPRVGSFHAGSWRRLDQDWYGPASLYESAVPTPNGDHSDGNAIVEELA